MDISNCSPATIFNLISHALREKWQRKCGSLGPPQVLYSIMCMVAQSGHGYRQTLDYLKRQVGEKLGWDSEPWPSSFSEARRKLKVSDCLAAFRVARNACTGLDSLPKVAYQQYRLVAVDMTKLALPPYESVKEGFGCPKDAKGKTAPAPQATLTALWDISSNTPIDWRMERVYASERFAAHDLVTSLDHNDLLIADRGYPSRRLLKQLIDQKTAFLLRMPSGMGGGFREVRDFANDDSAWDREILLHETNAKRVDPTLRIRLMKRRLACGKIAVFATNLFGQRTHKRRALCDLYCYRWDIETAFKEMKVWHGLENFRARFADGIHQEVAGLMLFLLLTAEVEAQARAYHTVATVERSPDGVQEPEYRFNRKQIAECVGYLLAAAAKGPEAVEKEFEYCMKQLWRFRQRRKHGRSFPRTAKDPNSKYKKSTYNRSKNAKNEPPLAE